jgi:hypothetical protein
LANPPTDPFLATADPAIYDLTLRDVIPGLIVFCLQVNRISTPPVAPETANIVHMNPATGEIWRIASSGKIHKTPPLPDRYRTTVANEIWRLINAYDAIEGVSGDAGQIARQGLLRGIQEVARVGAEYQSR